MLAVPPPLLHVAGLRAGAKVGIAVENGRLVVEPHKRPRYTLDELLARCHPKSTRPKPDRAWLGGKPTGRELL